MKLGEKFMKSLTPHFLLGMSLVCEPRIEMVKSAPAAISLSNTTHSSSGPLSCSLECEGDGDSGRVQVSVVLVVPSVGP